MKKGWIGGSIAIAVGIAVAISFFSSESDKKISEVFHVTLADPDLYKDGIFTDVFEIKKGVYQFRFTPNGDSPKILSITLGGNSFSFSENFELQSTPHETGISVYYTWGYMGSKKIQIAKDQELRIIINPHNDILGPVSVELIPLG